MTIIHRFDPLLDPRWDEFLNRHPAASVFHSRAWLEALRRTYGYRSEVLTSASPDQRLEDAVLLSRVDSWLTGSRLVSVPFADHCQPLMKRSESLHRLMQAGQQISRDEHCKYVEFRCLSPLGLAADNFTCSESFVFHRLDLRPCLERLFAGFHKSCVQRRVHRAERERLDYAEGSSDEFLRNFYRLLTLTRKRHGLPPQPFAWFRNLRDCFGNDLKVRLASKSGQPLGGLLTLRFKNYLTYKYGGSDLRYHHFGTMPWLFWQVIMNAKETGLDELDLGRSSQDDEGLIAFKRHLGAESSTLQYYRYPSSQKRRSLTGTVIAPKILSRLPSQVLKITGTLMYRHMG